VDGQVNVFWRKTGSFEAEAGGIRKNVERFPEMPIPEAKERAGA
jgi:hypothetical protein